MLAVGVEQTQVIIPITIQINTSEIRPPMIVPSIEKIIPAVATPLPDEVTGIPFLALTAYTIPIMLRKKPRIAGMPLTNGAIQLMIRPVRPKINDATAFPLAPGAHCGDC